MRRETPRGRQRHGARAPLGAVALGLLLGAVGVAQAAPPVPEGPFRTSCAPCTMTAVGTVGTMLGCMCGPADAQVPASLYLPGGRCDAPIVFADGELSCGPAATQASSPPPRASAPDSQVALADPVAPRRDVGGPRTSELSASRLRLAALGAVSVAPAQAAADAVLSVDAWNALGNAPIRLAPLDCVVTEDGTMACMCPRTNGLPASPSVDHLKGDPSAWTCGCTDKAGLVCVAEP
ncbi:MAG: hypothetical protein H6733_04590 [Alphaproteobacteria bacterium]|nr:hypothetical protein [Alphaproteobacteria bacterium]